MKKFKQVLIIGRFQPLCKNHLALFDFAFKKADHLLIAVGRTDYSIIDEKKDPAKLRKYKLKNLFSYERTKEFLEKALKGRSISIIPVYDIPEDSRYAEHVKNEFLKAGVKIENCVLLGENKWTLNCFKKDPDVDTFFTGDLVGFHATDARQEISKTGFSDMVACDLSKDEIYRIKDSEDLLKEVLEKRK